jgi:hypothetical protein
LAFALQRLVRGNWVDAVSSADAVDLADLVDAMDLVGAVGAVDAVDLVDAVDGGNKLDVSGNLAVVLACFSRLLFAPGFSRGALQQ